jgi:hypothetical protein
VTSPRHIPGDSNLIYFTVTCHLAPIVADLSQDSDYDPNTARIDAVVTFTPKYKAGEVIHSHTSTPPTGFLALPVTALIDDGYLKLRSKPDAGAAPLPGTLHGLRAKIAADTGRELPVKLDTRDALNYAPVRLLGNSTSLEIDPEQPLFYDFSFSNIKIDGKPANVAITGGTFEAPWEDTLIDLLDYMPLTPGPFAAPMVVGPQGPPGPPGPATIAVGSTTTSLPGSAAAVTNSGTTEDLVLDFVIPRGEPGPQGIDGPPADQLALAAMQNSTPNLLLDGSYERDATWWAGEMKTGVELSAEQAFQGAKSLKMTGARTHRPNVTASGKAGGDAAYAVVKSAPGRLYRVVFRVFRGASNTATGFVRARLMLQGNNGTITDATSGWGPNQTLNQSAMTAGAWVEYANYFTVPNTGTNAPYVGVYPILDTSGVDAADVFYIDTVRLDDLTDAPAELLAPPPSGVRAVDTARLQALVDLAQMYKGTVVLREGTYAADVVTKRGDKQPRIVGQGQNFTFWDGTIKFQGNASKYGGGWLAGMMFVGTHTGKAAIEFNNSTYCRWDEIRVFGNYDVGILFHNEGAGSYTELCSGVASVHRNTKVAVEYRVTSGGTPSFHGSGLEDGSNIQKSTTNPAVLVSPGARPYNAPLSVRVWTNDIDFPVIQQDGLPNVNFFGNLCVESGGDSILPAVGAVLAGGTNAITYYQGTLSTYLGGGQITYGSFRLVNSVAATTATGISVAPTVFNQIHGVNGTPVAQVKPVTNGAHYLVFENSAAGRPQISAEGPAADIGIFVTPKGGGDVSIYRASGQRAILSVNGADPVHDFYIAPKGSGSAIRWGTAANAVGWYTTGVVGSTPEGSLTAPVGSFLCNPSYGVGTGAPMWVKETGAGATGWSPLLSKTLGDNAYSAKGHTHVAGDVVGARTWAAVPTSSTAAGTAGQEAYDANWRYICVTTGAAGAALWKRTAYDILPW